MNRFKFITVFVVLAMLFSFANVSPASAAATYPENCQDILDANPAATDGDYVIYPNGQVFTVYCYDMAGTPSEYLTLANTGGSSNFSQMTAGHMIYSQLVTHYTKVRLDPVNLLVDINDKTFSSTTGFPSNPWGTAAMDYATGVDCPYPYAQTGRANIDLRETPFAVNTTFITVGYLPSAGSAVFSADDQIVDLQGGGYCGWISPGGTASWLDDNDAFVLSLRFGGNHVPTTDAGGPYLVAVNSSIDFDGSGSSDPDGDALTEAWTAAGGSVVGNTYTAGSEAGIFDVCLKVNDGNVDSTEVCTIVVVYDPSGGFVTGGGWIDSPAGAYKADESLSGKATFGFVAKYKKGATVPDGNTEFQFKAGDLNFKSTSYEWLVVAGSAAQFKGEGTINGEGSYSFRIWADDGATDTFRIQIWDANGSMYDNGAQQSLGGGSIKIHQ